MLECISKVAHMFIDYFTMGIKIAENHGQETGDTVGMVVSHRPKSTFRPKSQILGPRILLIQCKLLILRGGPLTKSVYIGSGSLIRL